MTAQQWFTLISMILTTVLTGTTGAAVKSHLSLIQRIATLESSHKSLIAAVGDLAKSPDVMRWSDLAKNGATINVPDQGGKKA